jgi:putative endonuclease
MNQILPYCVYVLISEKDKFFYIGYTSDIQRRLAQHHSGQSKSTAPRRPLKLIFCEFYLFKKDAMKRENYFKTTAGKKALKLMLTSTLENLNYKFTSLKDWEIVSIESDLEHSFERKA